jgi:hypothetical protein
MNDYFQHDYLSNSDLKAFKRKLGMVPEDPENLQEIFDLGTLIHATILEPHLADKKHDQYELALAMRETFWKDSTCRHFASADDFHREKPHYESVQVGPYRAKLRCKCDGERSRTKTMLELKGLGVETEKAFREALVRYNYDQAAAHYMLTGDFRMCLIVGISKKDSRKLFKWIVKKHDDFYLQGEQKLIDDLTLLKQYSPEDVVTV